MSVIFKHKGSSVKIPQRGREPQNEEYGGETHKGALICPECHSVYHRKKWYHEDDVAIGHLLRENGKVVVVKKKICPACKMIKDHLFEGELFVENVPKQYRKEIFRLIHGFGEHAREKDPQDRLIQVTEYKEGCYRVTTTENQLAVRMAKKIQEAFAIVDVDISYSPEPAEVSRIHAIFG